MQTPRTEFAQALKAMVTERGLDADVIIETIKQAIIAAYRRDARDREEDLENYDFDAEIDPVSGGVRVFSWPLEKPEERKDVTPPGFGRIAAQTAKQVIHQKIREAEKSTIMDEFQGRVGSLVSGTILRFDGPNVRIDLGRTEATMLMEDRVPNERLQLNQRLTFLLKEIREGMKGKELVLSRADPQFVVKLFAREVPEIGSGSVEVKSIVREPGVRTKMTVFSNQSGVDPVGSCVGQKGVRVQAVTNELGGERVDIIPFSEDMAELIKMSLSPAENVNVTLDEDTKTAHVSAPEDQLSMAIGRDGQNARLAAKLTGWRIEVVSGDPEMTDKKEEEISKKEVEEKPAKKSKVAIKKAKGKKETNPKKKTKTEESVSDTEKSENEVALQDDLEKTENKDESEINNKDAI